MASHLVVIDQTLGGDEFNQRIRERAGDGASFRVLVPMTDPEGQPGGLAGGGAASTQLAAAPGTGAAGWGHLSPSDQAGQRLEEALEQIRREGAEAEGEVVTDDPDESVARAVGEDAYDEVIVATPPSGAAGLIGQDLASRIRRKVDVPVVEVHAPRANVTEAE